MYDQISDIIKKYQHILSIPNISQKFDDPLKDIYANFDLVKFEIFY